jgi:hypothetical protein
LIGYGGDMGILQKIDLIDTGGDIAILLEKQSGDMTILSGRPAYIPWLLHC